MGTSHRQAHQNLILGWHDQGQQARHQQDQGGLNVGNPALVNPQDFHGHHAHDFVIDEKVPYGYSAILNTQQQQSTSGGPGANAKPVAGISTHSADNQELLMSVYGDKYRFSTSVPGGGPQTVSPVATIIIF
ncbi:hypothetical protein CAEBREN_20916 [Caenorhabditis brenneri]|uniref:Uncharacterized protein n=1 Tax=Caenorhabditis brenneri TaxID=135651 RepID=G0P7H4_CAEBE|nr:hypothetical protein CAEBREN_20916 [Caenorhabditis brenneri]